jgi:hypothetical protein
MKGLSLGVQVGVASALAGGVFLLVYFGLVPHITQQLHMRREGGNKLVREVLLLV